jgi:hypothetical protein
MHRLVFRFLFALHLFCFHSVITFFYGGNYMRIGIKHPLNAVLTLGIFSFLMFFNAISAYSETATKVVESGATWTVSEKTTLTALAIRSGATIKAADGFLLTMTVDGVETPIKPGSLKGNIVLTPTKKIGKSLYTEQMGGGGTKAAADLKYRTALFIDGGKVVEESSATSALVGGSYDGKSASGMTITSNNDMFEGIMINDSGYKVSNVTMTAKGGGLSDFLGYGAGIGVTGKSKVEIDHFTFNAEGPIRHGIYVGGDSPDMGLTVTVNNSFIKANGSVGEVLKGSAMSNVPWVLGIETYGHVRAQMIAGYGNVTYKKSTLLSDGWGVLSTDAVGSPKKYGDTSVMLKVEDSIVDITGTSGYGSYSIGACRNIFSNTVMGGSKYSTSKYGLTYALIVANEYAGGDFVNGTKVTSRYGVMYHQTQTGITKVDSSTFNTQGAAFLIKSCYPVINVSNSKLNSEAGVIIQLMTSDDPGMTGTMFSEALDAAATVKNQKFDVYHVNKADTSIFNTTVKNAVTDAQANFSNMDIKGDFYNSISGDKNQNLVLSFDKVNITGVISSSTCLHKNYSFYFSKEKDKDGNRIAVNKDGYQIEGKWEAQKSMMGPGGGDMPGGAGGGMPGAAGGAPGGASGGATAGMPGANAGGAPQMAQGGAQGGGMPAGGMPGGMGGMPGGMGGQGGGSTMGFTPKTDAKGNYVVAGSKKYDLNEGAIVEKNATYLGDLINKPAQAVNNGVIVTLNNGTVWTVTGTSYLTGLTLNNASITASTGNNVVMTIDGAKTDIKPGKTYTGNIVLSLVKK